LKKILLVDDEEMLRQTLAVMIANMGFEVTQAADGREGLKMFKEGTFDLVITDLVMPNKEGLELIVAIRRLQPAAKIIAISGGFRVDSLDMIAKASAVGADEVLYKPFSVDELKKAIQDLGV
jgi:DNA-binding response OmpR family regulator